MGGNTYWDTHGYSRIFNTSWVDQSGSADGDVTDWTIGDPFILVSQVYSNADACNKDCDGAAFKLQFQNVTDAGSWTDVGSATEISWGSGVVTDDASGSQRLTGDSLSFCGTGYEQAYVNEGDNTLPDSGTLTGSTEQWTELQWVLDTDNATAGKRYIFRIVDTTNSVTLGRSSGFDSEGPGITMSAGNIVVLESGSTSLSGGTLTTTGAPTVTDVGGDEDYDDNDTGITITGTKFETSQGTGKVEMGDNSDYATANKVEQTVTSWADTSIDFTADLSTQSPGSKWIFVTNNSGYKNDPGFAVTVHREQAFLMSDSANITAGGENTTAQLTAPSGKTTGDFDAGRIVDDENPDQAVDITADDYTEMEWCFKGRSTAREVQYDFRVTVGGNALDTTSVTPQLTLSGATTFVLVSQTLTGTPTELWANKVGELNTTTASLTGGTLWANKLKKLVTQTLSITGAALSANNVVKLITQTLSLSGAILAANKAITLITQSLSLTGATVWANKAAKLITQTLSLTGASLWANRLNKLAAQTLSLTGGVINAITAYILNAGTLTISNVELFASKTAKLAAQTLSLTGATLLASKTAKLIKQTLTLTGSALAANKVIKLITQTLTLTGATLLANNAAKLIGQTLTLIGGTLTTASGTIVNLVKQTVSLTGASLLANKLIKLTTQTLSLTGATLLANKTAKLIKQTLSLTGASLWANKVIILIKQTLSLSGAIVWANKLKKLISNTLSLSGANLIANKVNKLIKQTLSFSGSILKANKLIVLAKQTLTLTGHTLTTVTSGAVNLISGTLSLTGNTITLLVNIIVNLVKQTLTFTGGSMQNVVAGVKNLYHRFVDFF